MITKIKHHPVLTNVSLFFILMTMVFSVSYEFSQWLLFIAIPVLALYIYAFTWNENNELVCPNCYRTYWDKTNYYCNQCGIPMVFRKKEKIKRCEEPKKDIISIPTCSKGHVVSNYDKYCPKCGEVLKEYPEV